MYDPPLIYNWVELETSSLETICDNSGQRVQSSSAKLPSFCTHNYKNKKKQMVSSTPCLVGTWFPLLPAWLLPPFRRQIASTIQSCKGERDRHGDTCSVQLPCTRFSQVGLHQPLWTTTFKTYLGTPALEPMPEDCRECRRFLAVASGWASANCWMAACRALREAASLGGGMKVTSEHVDVVRGKAS